MQVPLVAACLRGRGVPAALVLAWAEDAASCDSPSRSGSVTTGPLRLAIGCSQGAPATALMRNVLLSGVVEALQRRLQRRLRQRRPAPRCGEGLGKACPLPLEGKLIPSHSWSGGDAHCGLLEHV